MCSRARLRSVAMSERKAPAIALVSARRFVGLGHPGGGAAARRGALAVGRVLRLDVGLRAVVARLGLLVAGGALVAFLLVAFLLGDVVLGLGFRLFDLALRARGVVL